MAFQELVTHLLLRLDTNCPHFISVFLEPHPQRPLFHSVTNLEVGVLLWGPGKGEMSSCPALVVSQWGTGLQEKCICLPYIFLLIFSHFFPQ